MPIAVTPSERDRLCEAARTIAKSAYAKYSHFRVGAAILGKSQIHVGANVENGSLSLSLCAERAAFATAVAERETEFRAVAVACIDAADNGINELLPCGACRQWMVELAPDATVYICGFDGVERSFSVSELMPTPFRLDTR